MTDEECKTRVLLLGGYLFEDVHSTHPKWSVRGSAPDESGSHHSTCMHPALQYSPSPACWFPTAERAYLDFVDALRRQKENGTKFYNF